jgi:hypothetical protein
VKGVTQMADREKVIKTIDGCINDDSFCNKCDYDGCVFQHGSCEKDLLADALALLKEQDAVEPEKGFSGSGVTWWYVCGNCKTAINPNDKYCHECGQAVKWE